MPAAQHCTEQEEDESEKRGSWRQAHPQEHIPVAPFGTVLGITDGGVEVCSCDYDTVDKAKYPTRDSFVTEINGIYTGHKYQCVELARRYLIVNHGITFESIPMAYNIFDLDHVTRLKDGAELPWQARRNGSQEAPIAGSLLIWEARGECKVTGHVAVIVAIGGNYVDIVEQNDKDIVWPPGVNYSRRLQVAVDTLGGFHISCSYPDTVILGWMNLPEDEEEEEEEEERAPE